MNYFDTILVSLLFAGAAFVAALLIGKFGEAAVEGRPELKAAQEVIPKRAQMEQRFEHRTAQLTQDIAKMAAEVSGMRKRRFTLEKELIDARREAEAPVRVIGREGGTAVHFRAWMINRQVQAAASENKQHATLDAEWATPQIIEVWAETLNEARKELNRLYPPPLGFTILNIRLETGVEEQVEA